MRLQSAIFDMDGTLLDSMPTWRELGPTFLKEAGISATPEQDRMLHTLADCDVIPYLRAVCRGPSRRSSTRSFSEWRHSIPARSGPSRVWKNFSPF